MSASTVRLALPDPHPLGPRDHPRFAVASWTTGGSGTGDVKLYEWRRHKREMCLVGLQTDVGPIRAAALSPIPTHGSLVALGLQTGRVLLLPLTSSTLSQPLVSPSYPVLPLKHARPVSSLAFSPLDPNYLAVGLDRHRSDPSLVVWDVERAVAAIPADRAGGPHPWTRPLERLEADSSAASAKQGANPYEGRAVQVYCAGEHVNSVAWFKHTVFSLLAGVNYKQIRLFDLRQPGSAPGGAGAATNAAGSGAGGAGSIAASWSTRAVSGVSPDPASETRFVSYEASTSGSVVRLWDTRKSAEVLSFDVGGSVINVQWGEGREDGRARLAVGTEGGGIGVWEVGSGRAQPGEKSGDGTDEWVELGLGRQVVKTRTTLNTFAFLPSSSSPSVSASGDESPMRREEIAFVIKDGTMGVGRIGETVPLASSARGDVAYGQGSLLRLVEPSEDAQATVDRNVQNEADQKGRRGSKRETELDRDSWRAALEEDVGSRIRRMAEEGYGLDDFGTNIELLEQDGNALADLWRYTKHLIETLSPSLARTTTHDLTYCGISSLWHGLPPIATSTTTTLAPSTQPAYPNPSLPTPAREPIRQTSAAWATLRGQQSSLALGRTTTGLSTAEASGQGVGVPYGGGSTGSGGSGGAVAANEAWHKSVEEVVRRLDGGGRAGVRVKSTKEAVRRLILRLCEVKGEEQEGVVKEKDRTKAAWRRFFSGDEDSALLVLLDSPDTQCRLYATTISAFLAFRPAASPVSPSSSTATGRSSTSAARGVITPTVTTHRGADDRRAIIASIEDAHIRSILLRASGVEWGVVVGDTQLPVLDRIWLGASNLPDGDFGALLTDLSARLPPMSQPLPLALPLFGLTPSLIPHLKAHVDHSSDMQLAALLGAYIPLMSCLNPEKGALKRWREGYREMLDRWGMWGERVGLDQGYMRIGRGMGELEAHERGEGKDGRGMRLCPACNNPLTSSGAESVSRKTAGAGGMDVVGKVMITERSGACSLCAQILPRCCICLTHVQAHATGHGTAWDALDQAYVHCLTCRHGGHAEHLLSWFEGGLDGQPGHEVCPVSGCGCECASL